MEGVTFFFILLVSGTTKHTNTWNDQLTESSEELTFEEVRLQAPGVHELVDQHPVLVLVAVADQFHQVLVPQLPKKENLCLQRTPHIIS